MLLDSSAVAERCGEIRNRLEKAQPLTDTSKLIEAMLEP
jgi:hypothetical protein